MLGIVIAFTLNPLSAHCLTASVEARSVNEHPVVQIHNQTTGAQYTQYCHTKKIVLFSLACRLTPQTFWCDQKCTTLNIFICVVKVYREEKKQYAVCLGMSIICITLRNSMCENNPGNQVGKTSTWGVVSCTHSFESRPFLGKTAWVQGYCFK